LAARDLADESGLTARLFPDDTTAITSMSPAVVQVTNRRYNHDPFWGGPKGLEYGLLVGAQPIQLAILYPDAGSTYFVGQFKLPVGSSLIIRGTYGHLRYFSYTVAVQLGDGQVGNGDFLADDQINPDSGSFNPYPPSSNRNVTPRNYTLRVVGGNAPADRPPNTLYSGSDSGDAPVRMALRNYLPDAGYDGTGNVKLNEEGYGLPELSLELADGIILKGDAMIKALRVTKDGQIPGGTVRVWLDLVENSQNPISSPALPSPAFQRFWNTNYSSTGAFITDPEERVLRYPATNTGGLANNPDTVYMLATFSLEFGKVVVIQGKMPTHQRSRHHQKTWEPDTQLRYWSATSGGTVASGLGWATIFDEEMPLDADGYYTIVMSWPEDRPNNATLACGVKWLDFGSGEGHYIGARNWVNIVYMRYMHINPDWPQSPAKIPPPSPKEPIPQDAEVMQEYYPRAKYMSKAAFEALGSGRATVRYG
jgi:hypothetical protein